jgi:hypothetical protein
VHSSRLVLILTFWHTKNGGDNLSYYVYENWVAEKKAMIHKGNCSFCNNGMGIHRNIHGERNGKWHPPFDTYDAAKKFAQSLRNRAVKDCSFCKP